jgi:hypothetical protein
MHFANASSSEQIDQKILAMGHATCRNARPNWLKTHKGLASRLMSLSESIRATIIWKRILRRILPGIALMFLSCQARAQFYLPIIINAATLKFFDPKSAFSASGEYVTETDGKPDVMPVKISILGNLTRVEMDITKERGGKSSLKEMAAYLKDLKTAGSAESVSIFNPDKKCTITILPRLKAYLQIPIPEQDLQEMKQRPKAKKTELGKDKIASRPCTKYRIDFAAERPMDVWRTWESPSATVWLAQDTPACPLQMSVLGSDGSTNCTFLIYDVDSGKVDKKLFEPPAGFAKCETPDALMKIIMEHWPKDKPQ